MVVMLTNLMELGKRKCEKYWPDDRCQYGPFEVSMNREEFTCDYVMRTFLLRQVIFHLLIFIFTYSSSLGW